MYKNQIIWNILKNNIDQQSQKQKYTLFNLFYIKIYKGIFIETG